MVGVTGERNCGTLITWFVAANIRYVLWLSEAVHDNVLPSLRLRALLKMGMPVKSSLVSRVIAKCPYVY